jgi:transcriptional regulator with XRE-family HTH domain
VTDPSVSLFDVAAMRAAIQDSGLAVSDIAFRVDIAVRALQRILNGEPDPGEIRVATLARLADTLGLPLRSLIAPPITHVTSPDGDRETTGSDATDDPTGDAATVIALLYDRNTPTLNSEVAAALGWPMDRLNAALHEANARLHPAGLRVIREHGESGIRPIGEHLQARRALVDVQAHVRGLTIGEYLAAYQMHTGQKVTARNETRRRFVLGRLGKVGVVDDYRSAKPTLTEAAKFAHPQPSGTGAVLDLAGDHPRSAKRLSSHTAEQARRTS